MNNNFPSSSKPIKLYRNIKSGHCHRVQLMMSLLELPHEIITLEPDGSNLPEDFPEISPLGQVPFIDDNGFKFSDSNAILVYLVKKYNDDSTWLPSEPEHYAKVQRWLSIASGELVTGPAIARFSKVFGSEIDYDAAKKKAEALFTMMNNQLNNNNYLAGDNITIADVSLFTYTAHAPEGGLKLDSYPNITSWIKRIESEKNYVAMKSSPIAE